jgi:hypothetical protein
LLEGGTVVLSVKVDKADTSLVLSLPSSKGAPAGLAVVPVSLVVPSPKPAPAKDALVSYKVGELERQVTISAGASAESAAAAAEIISTDLKPKTEQGSKQDPKK